MAGVRDPAFWKRFSTAVHLDEEKGTVSDSQSTSTASSKRPPLKHTDTWLERDRKKRRKMKVCGCTIALLLLLVIAGATFAILWLLKTGPFEPSKPAKDPQPTGS